MPREISLANHHPRLRLDRRAVARVIHLLDVNHASLATRHSTFGELATGELSLVFLTDEALAKLHADFLDDPTITDVITFEGNPAFGTAGEICISVDAALRQTAGAVRATLKSQSSNLEFQRELTLYLVHGWLHLAGHDDLVPAKKRLMRRAESRALRLLEKAAAIPTFRLS